MHWRLLLTKQLPWSHITSQIGKYIGFYCEANHQECFVTADCLQTKWRSSQKIITCTLLRTGESVWLVWHQGMFGDYPYRKACWHSSDTSQNRSTRWLRKCRKVAIDILEFKSLSFSWTCNLGNLDVVISLRNYVAPPACQKPKGSVSETASYPPRKKKIL